MSKPRPWAFTRRRDGRFGRGVPHLDGSCGEPDCQRWGGDELDGDGMRGILWDSRSQPSSGRFWSWW
jgi:hypothetical protein